MKQIIKSLFLVLAISLYATTNVFAYENWTSIHNSSYSSQDYYWYNVSVKAGQWLTFDWSIDGKGEYVNVYIYLEYPIYNNAFYKNGTFGECSGTSAYYFSQDATFTMRAYFYAYNASASISNIQIQDQLSISSIKLEDLDCGVNTTQTITINTPYTNKKSALTWSSSNTSVATVNQEGQVTGISTGSATITASYGGITGSCTVNVVKTQEIELKDTWADQQGTYIVPEAEVTPSCASRSFTWSSSDESIATVDSNGCITGKKEGTVTITAKATDGSGVSGSCKVNILSEEKYAVYPSLYTDNVGNYGYHIEAIWGDAGNEITPDYNWNGYTERSGTTNYLITFDYAALIYLDSNTYDNYGNTCGNTVFQIDKENKNINQTYPISKGQHLFQANMTVYGEDNARIYHYLYIQDIASNTSFDASIKNFGVAMDTIILSREGILGAEALQRHSNLSDFKGLVVSGPFDEYDWKTLNEMTSLKCLDISGVRSSKYPTTANTSVKAVKLSEYIDGINGNPFRGSLSYLYIPENVKIMTGDIHRNYSNLLIVDGGSGLEVIGDSAFMNSYVCDEISLPNLKKIGKYAFKSTPCLKSVDINNVEEIGDYAFASSGIENIDLDNLKKLGKYAFSAYPSFYSGGGIYGNYEEKSSRLKSISIPNIEYIEEGTFAYQENLSDANMPNVISVGKYAFYNSGIKEQITPNAEEINDFAFYFCQNLSKVDAQRVISIGQKAYYYCTKLKEFNVTRVQKIENDAFYHCNNLKNIKLPNITSLGVNAFSSCSAVSNLELSDKLTAIGDNCFYGCTGLETVTLPASLAHLPDKCFNGSNNIKEISINAPAPPSVGETPFTMQTVYTAQLYVPQSSIALYQAHDYWKHFYYYNVNPDVLTDLILSSNLVLGDVRTDKVRLTIMPGTSMDMSGIAAQDFRSVTFKANSTQAGMFLSNCSRISSDESSIELDMSGLTWYYICLPFDVQMSDILNSEGAQLAVHYYNGARRATSGTGSNWTRMYSGSLTAGTGYIIQASKATTLTLPATYDTKDRAFQPYDVTRTLEANTSSTLSNQGWNFIGNPYMTYFDIAKMDFDAPITVREGSTYTAYSIEDDEYALKPMQPFFVQCPEGTSKIKFDATGRQTSATIDHSSTSNASAMRKAQAAANRSVLDITLSNGSQSDRTRVVVNKAAADSYELNCDAAKMMSDGAVQLYSVNEDVRYAINEGTQASGRVAMGYTAPAEGEYTITLTRGNQEVSLYDAQEDVTVSLNEGAYTFKTEAGENEGRFMLILSSTTGIEELQQNTDEVQYFDLTGKRIARPENGINIKRQNGNVSKQIVR